MEFFAIRLDRWKARSVYFLNTYGSALLFYIRLEWSDRYGSEVGQKNDKMFSSSIGLLKLRRPKQVHFCTRVVR